MCDVLCQRKLFITLVTFSQNPKPMQFCNNNHHSLVFLSRRRCSLQYFLSDIPSAFFLCLWFYYCFYWTISLRLIDCVLTFEWKWFIHSKFNLIPVIYYKNNYNTMVLAHYQYNVLFDRKIRVFISYID